ncbi:MAG: hypothetical protein K2K72_06010 [Duncaniella sp.]|nr:hypothetical protein [Duncaniella sp.]
MKTTNKTFEEVDRLLSDKLPAAALDELHNALLAYPVLGRYKDRLEEIRQRHGYMRDYALQGLPDPGLDANLAALTGEIYALRDEMEREVLTAEAPTLYYNTVRFLRSSSSETLERLVEEYRRTVRRLSMASLAENAAQAQAELQLRAETLEMRLFNRVWTLHPLTAADSALLTELLGDLSISTEAKALLVSAITMGALEWHDQRRLWLLMDLYASESTPTAVSARALTGLLILLSAPNRRPLSRATLDRLATLRDLPSWSRDVRMAAMLFVRSRDTERLTRKFDEELMPEMMKMRPEIERLRKNPITPDDLELNPEWAEALNNSGLSDRLRELQELQEEGGDVMMATFRGLKSFPFFNDMPNWFRLFQPSHSQLRGNDPDTTGALVEMLASAPGLCDSDKYSIALSLSQMPETQRQMVSSQLRMQADAMRMASADQTAGGTLADLSTAYVRSIYRFFKLFRRKGEFTDPFTGGLDLIGVSELGEEFADREFLELIAEFYFGKGYWEDALRVYTLLEARSELSATIYQKLGFCHQSLGHYELALAYYLRADQLDPDNTWTLARLGRCYQRLAMWEPAADIYRRLERLRPDDTAIALSLGLILLEQERYDEALNYLHKVEFYSPGSEKAVRALARCTLAKGDYDNCTRYTLSLLTSASARPDDYMLAGNMAMITGHPDEATGHYVDAIKLGSLSRKEFLHRLREAYRRLKVPSDFSEALLSIVADTALRRASSPRT